MAQLAATYAATGPASGAQFSRQKVASGGCPDGRRALENRSYRISARNRTRQRRAAGGEARAAQIRCKKSRMLNSRVVGLENFGRGCGVYEPKVGPGESTSFFAVFCRRLVRLGVTKAAGRPRAQFASAPARRGTGISCPHRTEVGLSSPSIRPCTYLADFLYSVF